MTGGGTAGHINPALAIAETIRKNDPGAEIEFVGVRSGKEVDLVPREGYRLHFVRVMGFRRSLSPRNVKALYLALHSPHAKDTLAILDAFKPDIVIGTGGFASWPIMKAAINRGIPTAMHESNALPGWTVRQLQRSVDRIWINFEQTAQKLRASDKILRVGNPLRGGFGSMSREEAKAKLGIGKDQLLVLSFGGSLGAESVNQAVIAVMKDLISRRPDVTHMHATGKRDYENCKKAFDEAGLSEHSGCIITDYIYDMALRMAAADVVVSRAGAMTLSELALMKKTAVLIPSPYVANNHQFVNAKTLADANAACLVEESSLEAGTLTEVIRKLIEDTNRRAHMEQAIAQFADATANRRIWEDIKKLIEKRNQQEKG